MERDSDPGLYDLIRDIENARHRVAEGGPVSKWLYALKLKVETDAEAYATIQIERKVDIYVRQREAMGRAVDAEDRLHARIHLASMAKIARAIEMKKGAALPAAPQQAVPPPLQASPQAPMPGPVHPNAGPSEAADPQREEDLALSLVYQAVADGWIEDDAKWQKAMQGATPSSVPPGISLPRVMARANQMRDEALGR